MRDPLAIPMGYSYDDAINVNTVKRTLTLAMVGGGPGAFIGPVHRMAAELDGRFKLVAGAFSSDADKSKAAGLAYGIDATRAYGSYADLIAGERARADAVDVIAIVTPNYLHLPIARAALEAGFHVISDKPATATLDEARALESVVKSSNTLYALTYTYTGYPLIREARQLCRSGALGAIRKVVVEYSQGWLSEALETTANKQAAWRTDPTRGGVGGCIADIGVHAFNLLEFVVGTRVVELCAQLSSVVAGRTLDDDCNVLLRLENDVPGILHATQIAAGQRNGLSLRVSGERGTLTWSQEDPNRLYLDWRDKPSEVLHAGSSYLSSHASATTRLPAGHPEGYIEAFANLYRDFADAILAGKTHSASNAIHLQDISEGVRGMLFIERALHSSRDKRWLPLA